MDQHTQIMQAFAQPAPMRASNGSNIGGTLLSIAAMEYLQSQGAPLTNANFDAARRTLTANPEMAASLPSVQAALQKMSAAQPAQGAMPSAGAGVPASSPMQQPMQPPTPMLRPSAGGGPNTAFAPQPTPTTGADPAALAASQTGASDYNIAQQIIATILGGAAGGALGYRASRMMQGSPAADPAMGAPSRRAPSPDPVVAGVLSDGALNGEVLPPQQALRGPAQAAGAPPQSARVRGPQDLPQLAAPSNFGVPAQSSAIPMPNESPDRTFYMPPERATSLPPLPANQIRDARGDNPMYTDKAAQTGTSLRTNPDGTTPASGKFTPTDNKRARMSALSPQQQRQQNRTGRAMNTPAPMPTADAGLDSKLYAPPPANFDPANPRTWPSDPRQLNAILKNNPDLGQNPAFIAHVQQIVQTLRAAPRAVP